METKISVHTLQDTDGKVDNRLYFTTEVEDDTIPVTFMQEFISSLPITASCHASRIGNKSKGKRKLIFTVFLNVNTICDTTLTSIINIFEFFVQSCIDYYVAISKFQHLKEDVSGTIKTHLHLDEKTESDSSTTKKVSDC